MDHSFNDPDYLASESSREDSDPPPSSYRPVSPASRPISPVGNATGLLINLPSTLGNYDDVDDEDSIVPGSPEIPVIQSSMSFPGPLHLPLPIDSGRNLLVVSLEYIFTSSFELSSASPPKPKILVPKWLV